MTTARGPARRAVVTAVVLLAIGLGVSLGIGSALGISAEPADGMAAVPPPVAAVAPAVPPPVLDVVGAPATERTRVALEELRDAVAAAPSRSGRATLTLAAGAGDPDDDTYRLDGDASALRVRAASESGAVRAVYDIAASVRAGRAVTDRVGTEVGSRLPFRMVDLGAVGVTPDPAQWASGTDYSHASKAFADVVLPDAPYVDDVALARAYDDFDTFVRHSLANGYTAVAFPGFIEFVTLEGAPDGPVYPEGDEHVARALAMRAAFTPFWDRAQELGMDVVLRTDMLTLTSPLEQYLTEHVGSLDTTSPDLWAVYTAGLDELYAAAPSLDGLLVRIGEAGRVYDVDGWDYYSALAVTSVDAVRAMLTALSGQAERAGRDVIFRSWSVGVGAVGDMHTNPDSYAAVLDGIDSPALVVSTKYTLGDFYSHLPLNETLLSGSQRRIVEFQSRREFESYGAFPNDLGAEYRDALQRLLAANPRIEGVWVWTQDGGPWRAGPMTLYLKTGFWQLYELNTALAGSLARDPDADVAALTADWARRWFSDDPATVTAVAQAMAVSREAVTTGLYIGPFAEHKVEAIGLEPPPMMWIFEWDILTGDSAVLDVISSVTGDRVAEAVAEGRRAVAAAERMRDLVAGTDPSSWRDPAMREAFLGTLDYEVDTLRMLAEYRELVLRQGQWHDTGSAEARDRWTAALERYRTLAASHLDRYTGDVDHPAYNLTAAELGIERSERDPAMAWLARGLLALAAGWLVAGAVLARRGRGRAPVSAAAASWVAATRPWRAAGMGPGMPRAQKALLVAVPGGLLLATRAVQTSFLAPVHLLVVLGGWGVLLGAGALLLRSRVPWGVVATLGGVLVARCALVLVALSSTGPGGYWFAFWTEPGRRTAYVTAAVALFLWFLVAAAWALSVPRGRRRAAGTVLAAVGTALAVPASVLALVGLEQALTAWNDQLGLLPWGLSRILGITVYLGIPADTAWWAAGVGAVLLVLGLALALPGRRDPGAAVVAGGST
ncbi:MAG TPA: hypothetical protein VFI44_09290 [Ornithinibacter sp.]|nr:hypothetical protein [Ornithinibacter sp.]